MLCCETSGFLNTMLTEIPCHSFLLSGQGKWKLALCVWSHRCSSDFHPVYMKTHQIQVREPIYLLHISKALLAERRWLARIGQPKALDSRTLTSKGLWPYSVSRNSAHVTAVYGLRPFYESSPKATLPTSWRIF